MIRATSKARSVFAVLLDYDSEFGRYPESLRELKEEGFIDTEMLFFVERSYRNIRRSWIYLGAGKSSKDSPGEPILISPLLYKGNKSVVLRNDGSAKSNRGWELAKVLGAEELKLAGERLYAPTSGWGTHKWRLKFLIGIFVIGAITFLLLSKRKRARFYLVAAMFVLLATLIGWGKYEQSLFVQKHLSADAIRSARQLLGEQFGLMREPLMKSDTFNPITIFDDGHEQAGWVRFPSPTYNEADPVLVLLSPMPIGDTWVVGFSDGSVKSVQSHALGAIVSKRVRTKIDD